MAITREQAEAEFRKYFTNRDFTETDLKNAQTYGTDIFKETAAQINSSGRSLEGTLPDQRTMTEVAGTSPAEPTPRTLGVTEEGISSFQNALRQTALAARAATRPGVDEELGRYAGAGVPLTHPTNVAGALERGTISRTELETARFSGALDILKKQEQQLAQQQTANLNFASQMMGIIAKNPELLASLTGAELEQLKSGVASDELIQKLAVAAQKTAEGEVEGMKIDLGNGEVLLVHPVTGEEIARYGKPKPGTEDYKQDVVELDGVKTVVVTDSAGNVVRTTPLEKGEAGEDLAGKQAKIADLKKEQDLIKELQTHNGLNSSVGPVPGTRTAILDVFGAKDAFLGKLDQLLSIGALNTLVEAKAQGATFGALNETEFNTIKNAANAIAARTVRDKNGKIKYVDMSEKDFVAELQRMDEAVQSSVDRYTAEAASMIDVQSPEDADAYIDSVFGIDEDETIDEWLDSVGGGPESAELFRDSENGYAGNPLSLGPVTSLDGSPLWKWGLDIDLNRGDLVPTPESGVVTFVGENGGFGNQVRIRNAEGVEIWLSHLSSADVEVGDEVRRGQYVGTGGNTGNVIPLAGGDGSHLDITVKLQDGSFMEPRQIARTLGYNA